MKVDHHKALSDSLELLRLSEWHKVYNVEDIYRYIIAPIKHDRLRLFYKGHKPIGLVTWCWLSQEASQKFLDGSYYITESDYLDDTQGNLWGIEFIAPYGDAYKVMKLIRQEHKSIYNKNEKVNWRRLSDPSKKHTKEFKT